MLDQRVMLARRREAGRGVRLPGPVMLDQRVMLARRREAGRGAVR
jgi:hypothetical protein